MPESRPPLTTNEQIFGQGVGRRADKIRWSPEGPVQALGDEGGVKPGQLPISGLELARQAAVLEEEGHENPVGDRVLRPQLPENPAPDSSTLGAKHMERPEPDPRFDELPPPLPHP